MKYKMLLAEDEINLRKIIALYFTERGFQVDIASDGKEALEYIHKMVYDIVILDIMMPKMNGTEVCKYIRKQYDVPIVFLTAIQEEGNIVAGYEIGADEYITKPFSFSILEAKVHALVKRYCGLLVRNGLIKVGNLEIEPGKRLIKQGGQEVNLPPKEYEILMYFIENKNQILSREQILNHIWGGEYEGYDRVVDTHIKKLRFALGESSKHIVTIIKAGYIWKEVLE